MFLAKDQIRKEWKEKKKKKEISQFKSWIYPDDFQDAFSRCAKEQPPWSMALLVTHFLAVFWNSLPFKIRNNRNHH